MNIIKNSTEIFKRALPAPFTIAVLLTFFTFIIAFFFAPEVGNTTWVKITNLTLFWERGLWNNSMLVFAVQMMLILVLGHTLALSKPVDRFIHIFISRLDTTAKAAAVITFFTVLTGLFNWGLALIFGAVFARKTAEYAQSRQLKMNYPLIGAAGYSGLMVWHGGISGSSLIKISEPGHLKNLVGEQISPEKLTSIPEVITFEQTVFGNMNILVSLALLITLPLFMFWVGKHTKSSYIKIPSPNQVQKSTKSIQGAEKLDRFKYGGVITGIFILAVAGFKLVTDSNTFQFFTPNNINLVLLGLAITFHGSLYNFLKAVEHAIGGAAGILIQFPLYFGIMGIINESGLLVIAGKAIASFSTETSYPIFTFFSAGVVNILVPSGGGQWAIQGPLIIKTALELNIPLHKSIMAMAYGDQLTNMIQPFWALPLLAVTRLKPQQILPYSLLLMIVGASIYLTALLIF